MNTADAEAALSKARLMERAAIRRLHDAVTPWGAKRLKVKLEAATEAVRRAQAAVESSTQVEPCECGEPETCTCEYCGGACLDYHALCNDCLDQLPSVEE